MSNLEKSYVEAASQALPEARCLPFMVYSDQRAYRQEKETVFHNDWVFVCAEQQLLATGDYFALSIAEEPIVVIRGKNNQLRALSNVCRHRGTLLNDEGVGQAKRMICPYHAWTYETDGQLIGVPYGGDSEVDKQAHCLPEFALEIWQGLVFVSLASNAPSLRERYASIERYLARYDYAQFDTYYGGNVERWQCNWKLAMENAMESYHLFKVHKDTLEAVTPTKQAFYLEGGASWSLTGGKYKNSRNKLTNWLMGEGDVTDQYYVLISLPPSFVGILSRESLAWVSVYPAGTTECVVRSGALSIKGGGDSGEDEFTAAFFAEDKMICERVQQGMASTHSHGGSLIEMERVVVDFHQYLASRLMGESNNTLYSSTENIFFD